MYFLYQVICDYDARHRKFLHAARNQSDLYAQGFHCISIIIHVKKEQYRIILHFLFEKF